MRLRPTALTASAVPRAPGPGWYHGFINSICWGV